MRSVAAVSRRKAFSTPAGIALPWARIYISAVLVIWAVSPFLRRLMDWKTHYSAISPFAALPLLMLVPAAVMLFSGRVRRINRSYEVVAILWTLGFGYALVVAILAGHLLGGVFTFVLFCLPLAFGLWVATRPEDSETLYRTIAQTAVVLGAITGVYGVIQYVLMPPWDAAWMISVEMPSIGVPLPYGVRVFSMLNSPGTFATFLTGATIMFLPKLRLKTGLFLLPIFIGLGLSLVRASWITVPLGILVFAGFTTRRAQLLKGVATFVGIGVLAIALAQPLFSIGIGTALQNRLATLTDISHDNSAADRARQMSDAFDIGIHDPEGSGLGFAGVGSRLNSAQASAANIDSGYLSRFLEMGVPGMITYLAALAFAFFAAFRAWKTAVRNGDGAAQDLAALAIAMQVTMAGLEFFGDAGNSLTAILYWSSLALVLRSPLPKRALA